MIGVLVALTGVVFSVTLPIMFVLKEGDSFSGGLTLILILVGLITSLYVGHWAEEVERLVNYF